MPLKLFYLFPVAVLFAPFTRAEDSASLNVNADPAVVAVKPLAEGRRLIRTSALEYLLRIEAECDADTEIASISVSVADTQKTLTAADLGDTAPFAARITIPARQVPPIAVEEFCPVESPRAGDQRIIRDALTAHLSLRCTSEVDHSITYASRALDMILQCQPAAEAQSEPPSLIAR